MEIIKNNKGGEKLCYEGHMYTKHVERGDVVVWRCVKRNSGCKGQIQIKVNNPPVLSTEHNHLEDQRKVDIGKVRADMKDQARRFDGKPSQIIARSLVDVPVNSLLLLPSNDTLIRTIQNEKKLNISHRTNKY